MERTRGFIGPRERLWPIFARRTGYYRHGSVLLFDCNTNYEAEGVARLIQPTSTSVSTERIMIISKARSRALTFCICCGICGLA
jgi:hypothetical protein